MILVRLLLPRCAHAGVQQRFQRFQLGRIAKDDTSKLWSVNHSIGGENLLSKLLAQARSHSWIAFEKTAHACVRVKNNRSPFPKVGKGCCFPTANSSRQSNLHSAKEANPRTAGNLSAGRRSWIEQTYIPEEKPLLI